MINKNSRVEAFREEYFFLSNFYEAPVVYKGYRYLSNEAAFQAQKCANTNEIAEFTNLNPSQAKKKGRHVVLRDDWESVKVPLMEEIVRAKFTQNPKLRDKLLETGEMELIEGNWWKDTFWGKCNGVGENHLGKILMKIREELN